MRARSSPFDLAIALRACKLAPMSSWLHRIERSLFIDSRSMHGPAGVVLRTLRFPSALLRDWLSGEVNMRAMGLVYTTLLSLVPLMAFSFSILKGLGAHGDLEPFVFEFFRPMGAAAEQLTTHVMGFVDNVRSGVLGSIGLAFLLYTVITTVQKVEESFNFVWRVERPRSWARRVSEYFSVMIIGPILMVAALGLLASRKTPRPRNGCKTAPASDRPSGCCHGLAPTSSSPASSRFCIRSFRTRA